MNEADEEQDCNFEKSFTSNPFPQQEIIVLEETNQQQRCNITKPSSVKKRQIDEFFETQIQEVDDPIDPIDRIQKFPPQKRKEELLRQIFKHKSFRSQIQRDAINCIIKSKNFLRFFFALLNFRKLRRFYFPSNWCW